MPSEAAPAVAMAKDQAVVDAGVANKGQSARSDESMLQFSTIARAPTRGAMISAARQRKLHVGHFAFMRSVVQVTWEWTT